MTTLSRFLLLFAFLSTPLFADRILDTKKAEKTEIRHSMMGFRSTLLFYTFENQQAILTLSIGNKDESFPVKAKVHLFAEGTSGEGLGKWINNQHSDGIFPDVPNPTHTAELPEGTARVITKKRIGTSKNPSPVIDAMFNDYDVKLMGKKYTAPGKFTLRAFTDSARVHVKAK